MKDSFYVIFCGAIIASIFFEPTRWIAVFIFFQWMMMYFVIKRLFFAVKGREIKAEEYEEVVMNMFPLIGRIFRK